MAARLRRHGGWRLSTWAGAVTAGVAVALGAVLQPAFGPGLDGPPARAVASELPAFDSCADLQSWHAESALPQVTAWGFGRQVSYIANRTAIPMEASMARGAESFDLLQDGVGNGGTGTNLQEQGVDEPDIAKTNGQHVVLLDRRQLIVVDVSTDEPQEVGRVQLPERTHPRELLLVDDRVVVLGSRRLYGQAVLGDVMVARAAPPVGYGGSADTTITTVDLSDPTEPLVVATERVDGELVSAREHDGVVRVAIATPTPAMPFTYPHDGISRRDALEHNRDLLRRTTGEDWLPTRVTITPGEGRRERPLLDCADVRHPKQRSGIGTVSIVAFEPTSPTQLSTTAVTADGEMVYASADRFYLATANHSWDWLELRGRRTHSRPPSTSVHAFDITGADTTYVASGRVRGLVHGRWAFSEHEGLLRVATMLGNSWTPRETVVSVLEERGESLDLVGTVGGMGREEQVRAVRWFDDLAVVVTFRQVDPLYTVDLSDSAAPRVVGKLKIPGFSAYLHPLGNDLLLGVGQDASVQGLDRGAQLSTFDLADLSEPVRVDTTDLGRHTYSPVQEDSRGFTYLPEQGIALVPVSGWSGGPSLAVAHVDARGGLDLNAVLPLTGSSASLRALPLGDGRVAVVAARTVEEIVDVTRL